MEEFGIAPRQVATKDEFLLSEKKAPKRPNTSLLEDSLCSMIVPARYYSNSAVSHTVTVAATGPPLEHNYCTRWDGRKVKELVLEYQRR